jgi:hypothetical protein
MQGPRDPPANLLDVARGRDPPCELLPAALRAGERVDVKPLGLRGGDGALDPPARGLRVRGAGSWARRQQDMGGGEGAGAETRRLRRCRRRQAGPARWGVSGCRRLRPRCARRWSGLAGPHMARPTRKMSSPPRLQSSTTSVLRLGGWPMLSLAVRLVPKILDLLELKGAPRLCPRRSAAKSPMHLAASFDSLQLARVDVHPHRQCFCHGPGIQP